MSDDPGNMPVTETPGFAVPSAPQRDIRRGRAQKLAARYLDGYRVADILVGLGNACKIIGYVLGGIAVLAGIIALVVAAAGDRVGSGAGFFGAALLYCLLIVFGWYVMGSLVAAAGELIRATLDGAVNTATLLTDDERASILSLD